MRSVKLKRLLVAVLAAVVCYVALAGNSGCGEDEADKSGRSDAAKEVQRNKDNFKPYVPKNGVEGQNYNKAQEIFDDPSTILWCSVLQQSSTSPIITVPIAGKLTSSSTSAFPSQETDYDEWGNTVREKESVDGLYHGSPPPYRFGFTPGGQYFEFGGAAPYVCTTAVNEFQRESIAVSVDQGLTNASKEAEKALREGDKNKAQQILKAAAGS